MFTKNFEVNRQTNFLMFVCAFGLMFLYPVSQNAFAQDEKAELEQQMALLKAEIERPKNSPDLITRYDFLANLLNDCGSQQMFDRNSIFAPLAPAASLCVSGTLSNPGDPTFNRVFGNSSGTGIGTGAVNNCSLSTQTAVRYDTYTFNLTGCTTFPTEVTITTCGPTGCQHVGNTDTFLTLYRNSAGDPLTGNGGLVSVFNPAAPCTNARGAQDDLSSGAPGTTNNPGGATCNQVNTTQCVAPCTSPSGAGSLSGLRRQLGNRYFTVVVSTFGNSTATGNYNLFVNAPAAGCAIAQVNPTAASVGVGGRVLTSTGRGISNSTVELSGGSLAEPIYARTNQLGYYRFANVPVGDTYIISVAAKRYTFTNPNQVINLNNEVTNADFISHQ